MKTRAALFALLLVLPLVAGAQGSIDTNSLRLGGARSTGGMLLPSSLVLDPGGWDLSLTYGHEGGVIRSRLPTATIRGSDRFREATWIEDRDLALLHFAVSPLDLLEVQVGLPILLGQRVGLDPELAPIGSGSTAFGDMRVGLRYGVRGPGGMTSSIQGGLLLPTGSSEFGLGGKGARGEIATSLGYQSDDGWEASLHFGYLMGEPQSLGDQIVGDTFSAGLLLLYRHAVGANELQWSAEALTRTVGSTATPGIEPNREALELLGGVRYLLGSVYVDAGGGFAPIDDGITPSWRLLASVGVRGIWEPAPRPEPKERVVYLLGAAAPAPAPPPAPAPSEPAPSEPAPDPREAFRALSVEERSVYFEVDSVELDGVARVLLRDVARALLESDRGLVITGFADDQGSVERNEELSRRRAELVRDVLVQAGVEAARLEVVGVGSNAQVGQPTPFGRSINRRVTFRWKE